MDESHESNETRDKPLFFWAVVVFLHNRGYVTSVIHLALDCVLRAHRLSVCVCVFGNRGSSIFIVSNTPCIHNTLIHKTQPLALPRVAEWWLRKITRVGAAANED